MANEAVSARVNPASFRRLMLGVKAFDPALARSLRANLRLAALDTVRDVQATLRESPPSGGRYNVGVRDALAAGTKVSILAGKRAAGVRIVTSASKLGDRHAAMLKAYNLPSFQHPAFGGSTEVVQPGRPYFGTVIKRHRFEIQVAIARALRDAIKVMHD